MSAYASGQIFRFIPAATNTGATTINITPSGGSALGAKNIFHNGAACVGGEITISEPCLILYDGTQFNLIGTRMPRSTTATTFTFNGTGGTSGSVTLTYQKIGQFVTINIPNWSATTGTGSTAATSNTAIPAAFRPAAAQVQFVPVSNNGAAVTTPGVLTVSTNGTLQLERDLSATAFTNAASAGLNNRVTVSYFTG